MLSTEPPVTKQNTEDTQQPRIFTLNSDILHSIFDIVCPDEIRTTEFDTGRRAPSVNSDFLHGVFDTVYPDVGARTTSFYTNLAPLCSVSRSWGTVARRFLYRTINLVAIDQKLFASTVQTTPSVRPLVRCIFVEKVSYPNALDFGVLLPNTSFVIDLARPVASGILQQLNVIHLHIDSDASWSPSMWEDTLRSWRELEVLRITGPQNFPGVSTVVLPTLHTLKFIGCNSFGIPLASPNTLHTLKFHSCRNVDSDALLALISRHSASLKMLTLWTVQFTQSHVTEQLYLDAISLAPNLEVLDILDIAHTSKRLLENLGPSIHTMSVGLDLLSSDEWLEYVRSRKKGGTTGFGKMTFYGPPGTRSSERWRPFIKSLKELGVQGAWDYAPDVGWFRGQQWPG
jgi:hypothetical protein